MTAGHPAKAVRRNGPGAVWFAECPHGCRLERAQSKEGAEHIADDHARATRCDCYCQDTLEFSPEPCTNCANQEAS